MSAVAWETNGAEMYVPKWSFEPLKLEGEETYNKFRRFYRLYRYMQKAGKRFWEIEVDDGDDQVAHLAILQLATRTLPEISEDGIIRSHVHAPPADLIDIAHGYLIQPVPDFSVPPNKKGRRPKLDVTYAEAHDIPDIRFAAMTALRNSDDLAMEVVRCFEGWRYSQELVIPDTSLDVARDAYQTYFFTIGAIRFMPALGAAATGYLKK